MQPQGVSELIIFYSNKKEMSVAIKCKLTEKSYICFGENLYLKCHYMRVFVFELYNKQISTSVRMIFSQICMRN